MRKRSGHSLQVPYPVEINDSPAMLNRRHTPSDFAEMTIDQFDVMIEECEKQPLVMGIALHTFVVGQPFRFKHLQRILEHFVNHPKRDKVWFARPGEIADHVAGLPRGTVPGSDELAE